MPFDERGLKLTSFAVESFGRLGEESFEFIDELATHGRRMKTWRINGAEKNFQGTTSSSHVGCYTGGHIAERSAVQAGTMRTSRSGRTGSASITSIPMVWGWSVDAHRRESSKRNGNPIIPPLTRNEPLAPYAHPIPSAHPCGASVDCAHLPGYTLSYSSNAIGTPHGRKMTTSSVHDALFAQWVRF